MDHIDALPARHVTAHSAFLLSTGSSWCTGVSCDVDIDVVTCLERQACAHAAATDAVAARACAATISPGGRNLVSGTRADAVKTVVRIVLSRRHLRRPHWSCTRMSCTQAKLKVVVDGSAGMVDGRSCEGPTFASTSVASLEVHSALTADRAQSVSLADTAPHRSARCVCPCVGNAPSRHFHWRPCQDASGALTADRARSAPLAIAALGAYMACEWRAVLLSVDMHRAFA